MKFDGMKVGRTARSAILAVLLVLAPMAGAQQAGAADPEAAVLIADDLRITADDKLVASGNVEAVFGRHRLFAARVTYDRETDTVALEGPIRLVDDKGNLVTADSGRIDREMENGLLKGARMVMEQHVQLAAAEMHRVQGRYSQLYKAAVTSCRVCGAETAPLWQIRAMRVIHDQEARQLYFENAQFRVLDVPVMYLPRLRLPDPTLERADGFLVPSFVNSSTLGLGVRVPYFVTIGDDKDLTITPFIATKTATLQYRYRQAFRNGGLTVRGAVSKDRIKGDRLRFYLFGEGEFNLSNDFVLNLNAEAARDRTYLVDYDYSDKDRLSSGARIERVRRDEHIWTDLTYYHSMREGEKNRTLPTLATNIGYERRIFPGGLGGELRFSTLAHGHRRNSNQTWDGNDFDDYADGRDIGRLNLTADWRRQWVLGPGILASLNTGLAMDAFRINQAGSTSKGSEIGLTPYGSVQLRWPWQMATASGAVHVIEPVVQASYIGGHNLDIPYDESTRVEFDEGNLFSVSRFPATDRWERRLTAAYGAQWTRFDPNGWEASLAAGQVWRDRIPYEEDGRETFTKSSGLRDHGSDLLLAGLFRNRNGMSLTARGLFTNNFNLNKAEARAAWQNRRAQMSASYIWLDRDPGENLGKKVSEGVIDASYRVARHWTINGKWRYDVARDESLRAGGGIRYTNECVDIALSVLRRFTSSENLDPSTNLSLTVGLRGFTAKTRDGSFTRKCGK